MKYMLNIGDMKVVLDETQIAELVDILDSSVQLVDQHVGKGLGDHGYDFNYIYHVKPFVAMDTLSLRPLSDERYDTMVLVTKLHEEKK